VVILPTSIRWADAHLESVRLDYDHLVIAISDDAGSHRSIRASGYIGFTYTGVWDETIIRQGVLVEGHEHAAESWVQIEGRHHGLIPSSGSQARNHRRWKTLVLTFSDDSELKCSAAEFVEE